MIVCEAALTMKISTEEKFEGFVLSHLSGQDYADNAPQEESSLPWDVLNYLQDVFDLAHSADFDEGVFQVYQMIGRSLCDQSRFQGSLQSDVSRELSTKLDAFDNSWRLSSGLSMENLWKAFRPATARDLSQLKFSLRVKGFGDRFDTIRWSSGASVQELETLQNSVISLHDAGIDTSSISFAALDVGHAIALRRQLLMR